MSRPFHCPPWIDPDNCEVIVRGTGYRWMITGAEWSSRVGEAQTMTLELVGIGPARDGREQALNAAPEDVRRCLQALYDLEEGLPPDKEAIVEISADDTARFNVRIVERNSQ